MQKYAHFFFSRQRQVDLIIGSDLADQLVLEYLKSGTESDDDAGTYRVTCLLIDAVGDFCRMGDRKQVKEAVQFFSELMVRSLYTCPIFFASGGNP